MKRPAITELDNWSYLYGSMSAHDVESIQGDTVVVDGLCQIFDDVRLNLQILCINCSVKMVRKLGFVGPVPVKVSYSNSMAAVETVLLKFNKDDTLAQIAKYGYGLTCFEPNEPRTSPCDVCQVETLVDNKSWIDS